MNMRLGSLPIVVANDASQHAPTVTPILTDRPVPARDEDNDCCSTTVSKYLYTYKMACSTRPAFGLMDVSSIITGDSGLGATLKLCAYHTCFTPRIKMRDAKLRTWLKVVGLSRTNSVSCLMVSASPGSAVITITGISRRRSSARI